MSSPENPPIDERFDGLVSELRAARPVAPDDLRRRVAAIAARPPAPRRTLNVGWVLGPAAAALAAGAIAVGVLSGGSEEQPQQVAAPLVERASKDSVTSGLEAQSGPPVAPAKRAQRYSAADHASRRGSVRRHPGCAAPDEGSRRARPHGRLRRRARGRDGAPRRPRADRPRAGRDTPFLGARHDPRPARIGARRAAEARPALRPHRGAATADSDAGRRRPRRRTGRARGAADGAGARSGARRASRRCRST